MRHRSRGSLARWPVCKCALVCSVISVSGSSTVSSILGFRSYIIVTNRKIKRLTTLYTNIPLQELTAASLLSMYKSPCPTASRANHRLLRPAATASMSFLVLSYHASPSLSPSSTPISLPISEAFGSSFHPPRNHAFPWSFEEINRRACARASAVGDWKEKYSAILCGTSALKSGLANRDLLSLQVGL